MINRLKIKFALINMLLVGIVLALVITAAGVNTYHKSRQEMQRTLEMALGGMQHEKEMPGPKDAPPDDKEMRHELSAEDIELIEV